MVVKRTEVCTWILCLPHRVLWGEGQRGAKRTTVSWEARVNAHHHELTQLSVLFQNDWWREGFSGLQNVGRGELECYQTLHYLQHLPERYTQTPSLMSLWPLLCTSSFGRLCNPISPTAFLSFPPSLSTSGNGENWRNGKPSQGCLRTNWSLNRRCGFWSSS